MLPCSMYLILHREMIVNSVIVYILLLGMYFGVFPNSNTGKMPYEVYNSAYDLCLTDDCVPKIGSTLSITG